MKELLLDYNLHESKVCLRYAFDKDMNDYLFEKKFFAFWNGEARQREITIKEEYVKQSLKLLCQLIRDWKSVYNFKVTSEYKQFLNSEAEKIKIEEGKKEERIQKSRETDSDIVIPIPEGLSLLPFQKAGVEYIINTEGKTLIADEMGLGKTVQAIAYLNLTRDYPVLVVCPATLKLNWRNELEKWTVGDQKIQVLSSKEEFDKEANVTVINYDILEKFYDKLEVQQYQTIIIDECHAIKNYRSKRTKLVKSLCKNIPHRLGLTGTPVINRPMEVWTITSILKPGLFNWYHFTNRYCLYGTIPDMRQGASNLGELQDKLRGSLMIRRLKKDVLEELPDKRRVLIPLECSGLEGQLKLLKEKTEAMKLQKSGRKQKLEDFENTKLGLIHEIEKMKQEAVEKKLPLSLKFIENLAEEQGKVVVFAHHKFVVEQVKEYFGDSAVMLYGNTKMGDRDKAVSEFQTNPNIKVFIGSMKACGFGITLHAASNVVFLEFDWTPSVHSQSEDRCHRIGQKNSVTAYYLALEKSIDIYVAKLLQEKQGVIDKILDDDGKEELKRINVFDELLEII